jgi:hypothetical protein
MISGQQNQNNHEKSASHFVFGCLSSNYVSFSARVLCLLTFSWCSLWSDPFPIFFLYIYSLSYVCHYASSTLVSFSRFSLSQKWREHIKSNMGDMLLKWSSILLLDQLYFLIWPKHLWWSKYMVWMFLI